MRVPCLAFLLVLAVPVAGAGQVLAPPIWGDMSVPGGVDAARRVLGLVASADRPEPLFLLDFADRFSALRNRPASAAAGAYFRHLARLAATPCQVPPGATGQVADVEACVALLGMRVRRPVGRLEVELDDSPDAVERQGWLWAVGADPAAMLASLNRGELVTVNVSASPLPLPVPRVWTALEVPEGDVRLSAIVEREDLTLFYRGLMALDDDTLAAIDASPALVRRLLENVRAFAVFARSLQIRDGAVRLPGGGADREVWVRLVGQDPSDPESFLGALLHDDRGRLGYFFDAVSRLDASRRSALLGDDLPDASRLGYVEQIYRVFKDFDPVWVARDEPFQLRAFDPAIAVAMVDVAPDGTVGPAWWPSLLERVTDSGDWPDHPDDTLRRLRAGRPDLQWLLDWLFDRPSEARRRFELLRYLQRQFSAVGRTEAYAVETAARTRFEMPALAMSLERLGVRDPVLVGDLGRRARALTRSGSADDVLPRVTRWQAAVGWLEQLHRHRPFDPAVLRTLLTSLASEPGESEAGVVARWIVDELLPALGADGEGASESSLLSRMLDGAPDAPTVSWEGLAYRLRPDRAALRSVLAVRSAQVGPRLDDLIALTRLAGALAERPVSIRAAADMAADLRTRVPPVDALVEMGLLHEGVRSDLERVVQTLARIDRERDLDRAMRERGRLTWIVDQITTVLAQQVLYALAVAPTHRPAMLYADGWRRHQLDARALNDRRAWTRLVWNPPDAWSDVAGDAGMKGALIGLDVALAEAQLRGLDDAPLLAPPSLTLPDRTAMMQALLFVRPAEEEPSAGRRIVASIAAGRQVLAGWTAQPVSLTAIRGRLEEAGVDAHRINLLLWDVRRRGQTPEVWLTVTEIFRIGGGDVLPPVWGFAGLVPDGCWCFEAYDAWQGGWLRDRAGSGMAGAAVIDLSLRLAEHLDAVNLPTGLAFLLLRSGTQEWLDQVWQNVPSDAGALAEFPARLAPERLDAYLLALVADGILEVDGGAGR